MTTWFTADTHFGHANIIKLCNRPFDTVEEMNEMMVINWNSVVADDDIVFHLGDVALGKIKDSLEHVRQLNGRKFLIPGNHDRCWSGVKASRRQPKLYTDVGFSVLPEQMWRGAGWRLCHFPYWDIERHDNRYEAYLPKDFGHWLIHGHVHNSWSIRGRQINVGVDVNDFFPISEEDIRYEIQEIEMETE